MSPTDSIYTVVDVNERLPLVRVIVRDAIAVQAELNLQEQRLEEMRLRNPESSQDDASPYSDELLAMIHSLEADEDRMDALTAELAQIGAVFADASQGLVEFCSTLDGSPVMLSWKFDEPLVGFWRGIDDAPHVRHPLQLQEAN